MPAETAHKMYRIGKFMIPCVRAQPCQNAKGGTEIPNTSRKHHAAVEIEKEAGAVDLRHRIFRQVHDVGQDRYCARDDDDEV